MAISLDCMNRIKNKTFFKKVIIFQKVIFLVCILNLLFSKNIHSFDYYVLFSDEEFRWSYVIFHIPIPDTTNQQNLDFRSVLYEYLGNDTIISAIPNLEQSQNVKLQGCEVYEHAKMFIYSNVFLTPLQKRGEIDGEFNLLKDSVPISLMKKLRYWGLQRDVP